MYIENIKSLYKKVKKKNDFKHFIAAYFDRSPSTVHTHWFGNMWLIPENIQEQIVPLLQNEINNQLNKAKC
jgi:hypothetical protein